MANVKLRIADLRHRKNMTQQELAQVIGVSFQNLKMLKQILKLIMYLKIMKVDHQEALCVL